MLSKKAMKTNNKQMKFAYFKWILFYAQKKNELLQKRCPLKSSEKIFLYDHILQTKANPHFRHIHFPQFSQLNWPPRQVENKSRTY